MKKICPLLLCLLLLCGCAGTSTTWETVDDVLPEEPVEVWLDRTETILIGVPQGLELLAEADGYALYGDAAGDFLVETSTYLASGLDSAVRQLTGYDTDRLLMIGTTRFGLPEYHFAWYAQTEEGGRLHQADLVMDGTCCYAVVCSSLEVSGNAYDQEIRQVFSSFGLYRDEGV